MGPARSGPSARIGPGHGDGDHPCDSLPPAIIVIGDVAGL